MPEVELHYNATSFRNMMIRGDESNSKVNGGASMSGMGISSSSLRSRQQQPKQAPMMRRYLDRAKNSSGMESGGSGSGSCAGATRSNRESLKAADLGYCRRSSNFNESFNLDESGDGCWYVGGADDDEDDDRNTNKADEAPTSPSPKMGPASPRATPSSPRIASFLNGISRKSSFGSRKNSQESLPSSAPGTPKQNYGGKQANTMMVTSHCGKGRSSSFDREFDIGPPAPSPGQDQRQIPGGASGRAKELSDLSQDGAFAPPPPPPPFNNSGQQSENKSQDTEDTGESTVPPLGAALGIAAVAGASADPPIPGSVSRSSSSPSHEEEMDEAMAAASLGLKRRHRRRASHPPPSLTATDLEKGYEVMAQLRRLGRQHQMQQQQQQAEAQHQAEEQQQRPPDPEHAPEQRFAGGGGEMLSKSVRFDSHDGYPHTIEEEQFVAEDDSVATDNERVSSIERRLSGKSVPRPLYRQSSDVSASEWRMDPLSKERAAVMKASRRQVRTQRIGKKKSSALNERSRKEYTFVLCAGMCLAFNSGYINGACLSGLLTAAGDQVSVSAFTGTYTKSALDLASGDAGSFGFLITMVLSFIGGSFLTAAINPRAKPYELGPQYGPTFLLGSLFLVASSILSEIPTTGRALFYFAAAANGLQNGMSSMYSGNLIRSSHYTGISTDIGLILGQVARGNRTSLWKLWVLLGLTTSFWTGGFVSWHATSHFRTHSLIFNACFFFIIGVGLIMFVAFINHVTIWQAAFGTWHWERALETLASVHSIRRSIQDSDGNDASEEFLLDLFVKIDTDGSGCIDEEELYDALREAGMKVSRKGIKAMMKLADDDGDGQISRPEWEALVTGKVDMSQSNAGGSKAGNSAKEAADRARREVEGELDLDVEEGGGSDGGDDDDRGIRKTREVQSGESA